MRQFIFISRMKLLISRFFVSIFQSCKKRLEAKLSWSNDKSLKIER